MRVGCGISTRPPSKPSSDICRIWSPSDLRLRNPLLGVGCMEVMAQRLPSQLAAKEISHQSGDFGMFVLQRKMSGVEQMEFGLWQIAEIRMGT